MMIKRTPTHFCVTSIANGEDGGLHIIRLCPETGTMERMTHFGEGSAFYGCYDPVAKKIYSARAERFNEADGEDALLSWDYNPAAHKATLSHRQFTNQIGTCYLHSDASERLLLLAHYNSASLSAFSNSAGIAAAPEKLDWHPALFGTGSHHERQEQPHPHCILSAPLEDSTHSIGIYAADLGSDRIWHFKFDVSARSIRPADHAFTFLPPRSGPRHLCLHPDGETLYCLNELSNTLATFRRDLKTGTLEHVEEISTLPEPFDDESFAGDLVIAPNGNHLYASNRGHDSIVCFELSDPEHPQLVQSIPTSASGPQNLCLSSDGRWLLCAHLPGGCLSAQPIHWTSGKIAPASDTLKMPGAACVFELL